MSKRRVASPTLVESQRLEIEDLRIELEWLYKKTYALMMETSIVQRSNAHFYEDDFEYIKARIEASKGLSSELQPRLPGV